MALPRSGRFVLLPALQIHSSHAVLSPRPLGSLGTVVHDVLPTQRAFLPLFSLMAASVSMVCLVCPVPLTWPAVGLGQGGREGGKEKSADAPSSLSSVAV